MENLTNKDLKKLENFVKEVEYCKNYSEDLRTDIFNRFQIPKTQKYFCPIFSLLNYCRKENNNEYGEYGYFGEIAGWMSRVSFGKQKTSDKIGHQKIKNPNANVEINLMTDENSCSLEVKTKNEHFNYKIFKSGNIKLYVENLDVLKLVKYLKYFELISDSDLNTFY